MSCDGANDADQCGLYGVDTRPRSPPASSGLHDPMLVQDPLHRGPGGVVAEVRQRPPNPRVAPLRILDGHPDHEHGDSSSRRRPPSPAAGAAVVFPGDQSPVPAQDRVQGDDTRDLRQDPAAEFLAGRERAPLPGRAGVAKGYTVRRAGAAKSRPQPADCGLSSLLIREQSRERARMSTTRWPAR